MWPGVMTVLSMSDMDRGALLERLQHRRDELDKFFGLPETFEFISIHSQTYGDNVQEAREVEELIKLIEMVGWDRPDLAAHEGRLQPSAS